MTIKYSVAVRNAQLDATETTIGPSPKLRILTGQSLQTAQPHRPARCWLS